MLLQMCFIFKENQREDFWETQVSDTLKIIKLSHVGITENGKTIQTEKELVTWD